MGTLIKTLCGFIILFCLAYLGIKLVAPVYLKKQITNYVSKNCKTCKLEIRDINISMPHRFSFNQISFEQGHPGDSFVTAKIENLDIDLSIKSLFNDLVFIKSVSADKPVVTLTEGNIDTPKLEDPPSPPSKWGFQVDRISFKDGKFVYYREHQDRHPDQKSSITVQDVNGGVAQFGSTEDLKDKPLHAHTLALLEESGKVDLTVEHILHTPMHVDVNLYLMGQNMSELNTYFDINEGIHLDGKLVTGHASVSIRGQKLTSQVHATYDNLAVKFRKMSDRNGIESFFSNLIASVEINKKNTHKPKTDRVDTSELERKPRESIVTFIFRGMKTAALKVATK